jgi:hypothetical protein
MEMFPGAVVTGVHRTKKVIDDKCSVYCCSTGPLTDDHVPPRAVFTNPRPSNLITVLACMACNQRFSRQEEEFTSLLSTRFRSVAFDIHRDEADIVVKTLSG